MTTYAIKTSDSQVHTVEAATYVIDSQGLRFVGDQGVTQAIFTSFDWMMVRQTVAAPAATPKADEKTEESSTAAPTVLGE
jgi:hypothetical protein